MYAATLMYRWDDVYVATLPSLIRTYTSIENKQQQKKIGDLIDILALINSGINFILYCSMSRQFRKTFIALFRPKFLSRWLSLDNENPAGHTYIGRDEHNGLTTQVTQV